MSAQEIMTAARRCEQAWWEQICEWESLSYGVAFSAPEFPSFSEAQQLRDVWLQDVDAATAFENAERYFAERKLTCGIWSPASGQELAPVESLMSEKGWRRESLAAMGMADASAAPEEPAEIEGIRILPARAMRRAYRKLLDAIWTDTTVGDAAFERLDDANYDVLLAVREKEAIGQIAYHEVGDFARIRDFFVTDGEDFEAIGRLLMAHALLIARRLLPRVLVACVPSSDERTIAFFQSCGFATAGEMVRYRRPA